MSDVWFFMDKALEIALNSLTYNPVDIPVGCIIVHNGQIISSGYNTREKICRISGHAEINALEKAAEVLGTHHLTDCKMFVTLEPCPMCAGAIKSAQIDELYFGAFNLREGAAGTVYNILSPYVKIYGGIKKSDCESLLKDYFAKMRL